MSSRRRAYAPVIPTTTSAPANAPPATAGIQPPAVTPMVPTYNTETTAAPAVAGVTNQMANLTLSAPATFSASQIPTNGAAYTSTQSTYAQVIDAYQCPKTFLRFTTNVIPQTNDLWNKSNFPIGAIIHPMAEDPEVQV